MEPRRDILRLERFLERVAADIYPEMPSDLHSEITIRALEKLEEFCPLREGKKVLDVGCGQGPSLEYFSSRRTD